MTAPQKLFAWFFPSFGLRSKLLVFTTLVLVSACSTLGWLIIHQQVAAMTDGLLRSGGLLAQHLAGASRNSLIAGDREQLERLVQGALAVENVAYVILIDKDGKVLMVHQKPEWRTSITHDLPYNIMAISNLVLGRLAGVISSNPVITPVIIGPSGPVLAQHPTLSPSELATLVFHANLPVLYDIAAPIRPLPSSASRDSALRLMLEEETVDRASPSAPVGISSEGLVEIGLSTAAMQEHVRTLLTSVLFIMAIIIGISLTVLTIMVRRMTTPLEALTGAAKQITAGNFNLDLPLSSTGEIGVLSRAFAGMANSVKTHEQNLTDLNRTLEERVLSRTQELETANRKLKDQDQRKSLFVSTASHELRTSLMSMKVHLENLRYGIEGPLNRTQQEVVVRVETNLRRLQHLLEDLLDLSQIELGQIALKPASVALQPVLMHTVETIRSLAARKNVTLSTVIPPDLPAVFADSEKIEQVCTNLLHNAVKFSPEAGSICLTAQVHSAYEVHVSIRDSGAGILPHETDKIFLPFYRSASTPSQARGTGLGLTIAKHLIELHHGRIWVQSVPGEGSQFSFSLPTKPTA